LSASRFRIVGWGRIPLPGSKKRLARARERTQSLLSSLGWTASVDVERDKTGEVPVAPVATSDSHRGPSMEATGVVTDVGGIVAEPGLEQTKISLWGEIDSSLRAATVSVLTMTAGNRKPIILDLSQVSFIDSTGLAFLIQLDTYATEAGIAIHLIAVSEPARVAMEMLGIRDHFVQGSSPGHSAPHTENWPNMGGPTA
jgi:anti-anti-sigma factor